MRRESLPEKPDVTASQEVRSLVVLAPRVDPVLESPEDAAPPPSPTKIRRSNSWLSHSTAGLDKVGSDESLGRRQTSKITLNAPRDIRNVLLNTTKIHDGDLLFVHAPSDGSPFELAVEKTGAATFRWLREHGTTPDHEDAVAHVAMIVADSASVVEAVPGEGVRMQTLVDFFEEHEAPGTVIFHGQVRATVAQAREAVKHAVAKVGRPYSDCFRPWTDEDCFYCSSLIDYAYGKATGNANFFVAHEYKFVFEPREFWEKYYSDRRKEMPTCAGTNPTLLLHSAAVRYAEIHFATKEPTPPLLMTGLGSVSSFSSFLGYM